jgi:hypothetical protein
MLRLQQLPAHVHAHNLMQQLAGHLYSFHLSHKTYLRLRRHVYDREPSMLSQHQVHVAAKQVKQSSLARFNLERSSCSSSGSAAAWPNAGAGSSCSSLVSEAGDHHHSLWQGRMQQPTQPQQQQPERCSSLQLQKQPQEEQQPQQQWDAVSKERAHSLPMPIGTPRGSSSKLQSAGSCPAAWDPAHTLDADATCCAVSPRSSSCSRADARGLRSSSLGSASEVHGCDGAAGVFATSHSLPLSSCLSASELESSAAVKSAAAEALGCSDHDVASAAAVDAGEGAAGRRRNRAVNLSDSASSTSSASSSGAHVKPVVGLVSLAAAEDDDEEEQLSPSMRRLLREAAAADELNSSGDSSRHGQQEDRQHQQQLLQHQGSNSSSLMQDDSWDCSAHGSFRAVSLSYKSKSVPEDMQDEQQQQQQPRVQLTSAHSAPAEIGAGALLRDAKVRHGKLMMPLSAPSASPGESLQQPHKQLQPQQHPTKQQQQPAMFSPQLSRSKQEQAAAAQAGASVCYGWELSPSGAASPCGAVHSTMLDLFADMAEEEVLLCRCVVHVAAVMRV